MKIKFLAVLLILLSGVAGFAACPDCGSESSPQIIFRCKKCGKTFCDECATAFPGYFMGYVCPGTVRCECGATGRIPEGTAFSVTCKGDIRILRMIK